MKSVAGVVLVFAVAFAVEQHEASSAAANPIRKVVTMLQNLQKKVEAEGEAQTKLHVKYMCYCKNGAGTLEQSISDANTKIPQLTSDIEAGESKKAQLDADLTAHRTDRDAAKEAMAEATSIREKQASEFAKEKSDADTNINALSKAISAIAKGVGGAFLQSGAAKLVQKLTLAKQDMLNEDRQDVLSFLSGSQEYAPQSGQITGILKQLHDEMSKDRADAVAAEDASIKSYDELIAAKKKEVAALTAAIEDKTVRVGDLAVKIVQMKNDLDDTQNALGEDQKFLADMKKNCATKSAEWDEIVKTRAEELTALAETITILNSDDALELFKKALPSASASLVQIKVSTNMVRARALALMEKPANHQLNFILLALRGKKIGFEKVISMIDAMVETLKTEQQDDDNKKEYCEAQFDTADDKKKGLERSVADLETMIAEAEESISTLKSEIEALGASIKALDESVTEATDQRKQEHADFTQLMAEDTAAKEVIGFAKNRLQKFYNPELYVPPPKRELSEEDRIVSNMGGTLAPTAAPGGISGTGVTVLAQVAVHGQDSVAPPPPPEAVSAYSKSSEENNGVIALMDMLVQDLDKEMQVATAEEKDSQADYEQAMQDAAENRAMDAKSMTEKEAAKADTEVALQGHNDSKASTEQELTSTLEYIHSLHSECDWLLQYHAARAEARSGEIDALGKAKAVLSGADYSLLQKGSRSLRSTNSRPQ